MVNPGAYRTVCVELKLQHLAVNAIAQSALLADLEHTTLSDDGAGIAAVFGALVKLVNAWLADATENASLYVATHTRILQPTCIIHFMFALATKCRVQHVVNAHHLPPHVQVLRCPPQQPLPMAEQPPQQDLLRPPAAAHGFPHEQDAPAAGR